MADSPAADQPESGSFASKLAALFREAGDPSIAEVAKAVGTSRQYLHELYKGTRTQPRWELVDNLAQYFGVSLDYFRSSEAVSDDTQRQLELLAARFGVDVTELGSPSTSPEDLRQQLELLATLQDSGIHEIALRSRGLSSQHRQVLLDMAKSLQAAEHPEESSER